MLKIREGNQFTWAWAITRGAEPEDLSQATELKFSYQFRNRSGRKEITEFTLTGNIITTALLFSGMLGVVNLKLSYMLPVIGLQTVDVDAFEIVGSSEEASEAGEFSMTSDMAIALQGKNAYEVWLQTHQGTMADYEAWQRQSATEAAASVSAAEALIQSAEGLRATAEITRVQKERDREAAEDDRNGAEYDRYINENDRLSAETTREQNEQARETAEGLRVTAEQTRQTNTATAITNANNAATNANTKAGLADTAATNANNKATLANDAATNANATNTSITTAEGLRVTAEQGRVDAEIARQNRVKQVTGTSTTDVMSQKAVTDELALKENTSNKQNSLMADGTGTKFPTVDTVNTNVVPYIPAMQGLQTVASKNQFYPIAENNTGAIVGKHQTTYWNGSAWVSTSAFGFGTYALQNNTGGNSNGFGIFALINNTGGNSNGFGSYALANNTGGNSNGFGLFALINNAGNGSNGFGFYTLQNNTGTNSNGFGTYALQNNTGGNSNGFGESSLRYNQKGNNTAIGSGAYSAFLDNTAGNKTADSTAVDITLERITLTAHGFGATNAIVNLKYASTTGTAIGGLAVGTIYQVKIIDTNTIEFVSGSVKSNLSSQGTGTHTFTPQFSYENTTCLGANTQPNKDNQVVLGSTAVDTVKMGGTTRTIASPTETGVKGEWCWDANYIYVCIATNTWKRIALTTW